MPFPSSKTVNLNKLKEAQFQFLGQEGHLEEGHGTLVFFPGESHGQRSLAGYSPRGRKELDMTEMT